MKWVWAFILALVTLYPKGIWAQGFDEVLVSKHNLFPGGPKAVIRDVCLICHVEQFEEPLTVKRVASPDLEQIRMPRWDPQNTPKDFLPLPGVPPPSGRGGPDPRPFGPSFRCLSCHDGVLGNDVHPLGFSSGRGEARSQEMISAREGTRSPDHPDSILYPRKPSGEFLGHRADPNLLRYWSIPDRDESGMIIPTGPRSMNLGLQDINPTDSTQTAGLVRTFLGVIHCDTCHNPHLDRSRPFLRLPAQNLCLVCHQR